MSEMPRASATFSMRGPQCPCGSHHVIHAPSLPVVLSLITRYMRFSNECSFTCSSIIWPLTSFSIASSRLLALILLSFDFTSKPCLHTSPSSGVWFSQATGRRIYSNQSRTPAQSLPEQEPHELRTASSQPCTPVQSLPEQESHGVTLPFHSSVLALSYVNRIRCRVIVSRIIRLLSRQ